jgi:ribonuclease D
MPDLRNGESVEVPGSGGRKYILQNADGAYSCTCMAWRTGKSPTTQRSCKHLKNFRGEQAEIERIADRNEPLPDVAFPQVLDRPDAIGAAVQGLKGSRRIWLDTETADWQSGNGRISLIQALSDHGGSECQHVVLMDVLDQPALVDFFAREIMADSSIEKVFHNSEYDINYLGSAVATNVTCTLKMAKSIPRHRFSLPERLSLKSLAEHFGIAADVNKHEQKSDWGLRPLTAHQVYYAAMDVVYLQSVHGRMLELTEQLENPATVSISDIEAQLLPIEDEFHRVKSEWLYLRNLLAEAMKQQGVVRTDAYELRSSEVAPMDVPLHELVEMIVRHGNTIETPIRLNRDFKKALGKLARQLKSVTPARQKFELKTINGFSEASATDDMFPFGLSLVDHQLDSLRESRWSVKTDLIESLVSNTRDTYRCVKFFNAKWKQRSCD